MNLPYLLLPIIIVFIYFINEGQGNSAECKDIRNDCKSYVTKCHEHWTETSCKKTCGYCPKEVVCGEGSYKNRDGQCEVCSKSCKGGCVDITGDCLGCKEGFWGKKCKKTCPAECKGGCINGSCTGTTLTNSDTKQFQESQVDKSFMVSEYGFIGSVIVNVITIATIIIMAVIIYRSRQNMNMSPQRNIGRGQEEKMEGGDIGGVTLLTLQEQQVEGQKDGLYDCVN